MGETNEAPIKLDEKLDNRLSTIEEQNKQILIYLEKKNKKKSKVWLSLNFVCIIEWPTRKANVIL